MPRDAKGDGARKRPQQCHRPSVGPVVSSPKRPVVGSWLARRGLGCWRGRRVSYSVAIGLKTLRLLPRLLGTARKGLVVTASRFRFRAQEVR
jgi:hypothetical protein